MLRLACLSACSPASKTEGDGHEASSNRHVAPTAHLVELPRAILSGYIPQLQDDGLGRAEPSASVEGHLLQGKINPQRRFMRRAVYVLDEPVAQGYADEQERWPVTLLSSPAAETSDDPFTRTTNERSPGTSAARVCTPTLPGATTDSFLSSSRRGFVLRYHLFAGKIHDSRGDGAMSGQVRHDSPP